MTELSDPHIKEAVAAAHELRARLGVGPDEPFDRDLLECAEAELALAVSIFYLPQTVAGAYVRRRRRALVFVQAHNFPTRQRFTLAHEVGHHVLGHAAVLDDQKQVGRDTSDPCEQQANYFASDLLVPIAAAQRWLDENLGNGVGPTLEDVVRMADRFHISPPAMLYRLSKGEFAGIDRCVLDPLWSAVMGPHEHMEIAERLEIGHGSDALSSCFEAKALPRLPAELDAGARERIAAVVRTATAFAAPEDDDAADRQSKQTAGPL